MGRVIEIPSTDAIYERSQINFSYLNFELNYAFKPLIFVVK